jgi:hypothetical protein
MAAGFAMPTLPLLLLPLLLQGHDILISALGALLKLSPAWVSLTPVREQATHVSPSIDFTDSLKAAPFAETGFILEIVVDVIVAEDAVSSSVWQGIAGSPVCLRYRILLSAKVTSSRAYFCNAVPQCCSDIAIWLVFSTILSNSAKVELGVTLGITKLITKTMAMMVDINLRTFITPPFSNYTFSSKKEAPNRYLDEN